MDRFDERLLQPVEAYNNAYKDEFLRNAEELFDSLTEKSKVDVEKNRKTVAKYKELNSQLENLTGILKKNKRLRVLAIITEIVSIAISCYIFFNCSQNNSFTTTNIFLAVGFALVGLLLIIFCNKMLNQAVKDSQSKVRAKEEDANKERILADKQMEPLNGLFDTHMTNDLMEKTVPMLNFDYLFTYERFEKLNQRYGFYANLADNKSTIGIISGEINGNPFVINRNMVQSFQNVTYTGSLNIYWTTQQKDSEGHWKTVDHYETLYASVSKPKPCYGTQTMLIYCNDAAPDLSFSRTFSHIERLNDSELKHFINKKERKINRKQKKAIKGKGTFTAMTNDVFDAVFGALNRDNEVQFRLMYTPLAQNNTMSLLRDSENFGDDFNFVKRGTINLISSEHLQNLDLNTNGSHYYSFDYDDCRSKFININCEYFRNIFFEFAPLLCIPLYQQMKPIDYIYKNSKIRNYTDYEAEFLVNKMGESVFKPSNSVTRSILKTSFIEKTGSTDRISVEAHAFKAVERVTYIKKYGGDGHYHNVPVHWTEYIPISKTTSFAMKDMKYSDNLFSNELENKGFYKIVRKACSSYTYGHGILGFIPNGNVQTFEKETEEYLNTNKNSNLNNNCSV